MSTAGKVLSVLVMLLAVVWVMLTAAVTQLNRNGTQSLETVKAELARISAKVAEDEQELQKLKDGIARVQHDTQNQLTVISANQANVEKSLSEHKEIFSRVTNQIADVESEIKLAAAILNQRVADKKAETAGLAQARKDVEQLMADRTELVNRLTELRDKFKSTLDENRSLAGRLQQKKSGAPTTRTNRTARPASFPR